MKKTINEARLTAIVTEATRRVLNELHGPNKIVKPHELTPWDGEEDPMEFDGLSGKELEDFERENDRKYDEEEYYNNMEYPDPED